MQYQPGVEVHFTERAATAALLIAHGLFAKADRPREPQSVRKTLRDALELFSTAWVRIKEVSCNSFLSRHTSVRESGHE